MPTYSWYPCYQENAPSQGPHKKYLESVKTKQWESYYFALICTPLMMGHSQNKNIQSLYKGLKSPDLVQKGS